MANSKVKTRHDLELFVNKLPLSRTNQVLISKRTTIRDKILNAVFGAGHEVVILVPGECIKNVSIIKTEINEDTEK